MQFFRGGSLYRVCSSDGTITGDRNHFDHRAVYKVSNQTSMYQQSAIVVDWPCVFAVGHGRQVLSTPDRPLSLFISHSLTLSVPWQNFLSPEFGTKFQTVIPLFFGNTPNFPKTQRGKPVCKNSARSMQPF